jgi:hypothetical protein
MTRDEIKSMGAAQQKLTFDRGRDELEDMTGLRAQSEQMTARAMEGLE